VADNKSKETTTIESTTPKASRRSLLRLLVVVGVLALIAACAILALQYRDAQNKAQNEVARLSNPQEAAKEEVRQLTAKVGNLVVLPNETPTLATVNDPAKLKDQAFFAQAEKGDKVLIFTQAKRAILYRPSTNKVIESAPVNIGDSSTQSKAAASSNAAPTSQTPAPTQ
jgi:type II secretory pathway pseudopilin PulG